MDANLKTKWVDALRSDAYQQAEGKLHDTEKDAYCCLGVLCKVMGAEFGRAEERYEDEDTGEPTFRSFDYVPVLDGEILSNNDDEELKESFCKKIGIPHQFALIELNDGCGSPGRENYKAPTPFLGIADWIEANIPADQPLSPGE